MTRPGPRWWPLASSLVVFLASLLAGLHAGLRWTQGHLVYSLDDAYIHMAMAKNLARSGVWGCTPFHFSSSSSSPLWTLGLGVAYSAFGVHDATPLVINVAFAVATLVVSDRALIRFGASPFLRAAALVGLVLAFPLAGMVLMGMEHVLHLLLTIAFAALAVATAGGSEVQGQRRRTLGLCVLAALLAASRYEGCFLVGLVCLVFLARRQLVRAVAILASALAPLAVLGALSVARGSFWLPNSLMLKAAGRSASLLSALLNPFGSDDLEFLRNDRAMPVLLALGLLAAVAQWLWRRELRRAQLLLPVLLAAMIVAHGHWVFSSEFWVYRYDGYLVGFGIFAVAVVLTDLPPRLRGRSVVPVALLAALVAVVADVPEGLLPAAEVAGMRNTYLEHYQTAQFVRRYYPGAVVVVNDLGAVTYYTENRILDLVGLGDVEPLRMMRGGGYDRSQVRSWTAAYRPTLAIVQLGWSLVGPLIPGEWIKVAEVEVPPDFQRVGFFAVDPAESWRLRASVAQHFAPLAPTLGYRLKLRRAERVDQLASEAHASEP